MTSKFVREERYIVFKVSDLGNSFKGDEVRRLAREYAEHRQRLHKEPLECVVVEKSWPEYELTWRAIEARVTGAQPLPSGSSVMDAIIDDLQSQYDTEGITEHDSGDALIRLSDAIAAVEDNFAQPAQSVPDGWEEAAIAWEVCGSLHREYAKGKDPFFKKRQEDFVKHANDARAMIAAAPEAKP